MQYASLTVRFETCRPSNPSPQPSTGASPETNLQKPRTPPLPLVCLLETLGAPWEGSDEARSLGGGSRRREDGGIRVSCRRVPLYLPWDP